MDGGVLERQKICFIQIVLELGNVSNYNLLECY
jgi:hypothetical protein